MDRKLHQQVNRHYTPLIKDDGDASSNAEYERAYGFVMRFMPVSWGGNGDEDNPVFMEAIRLVNEEGIVLTPQKGKPPNVSFIERYAQEEIRALINSAALALVGIEHDNKRPFTEENIPLLFTKTMQEIYTGKNKIHLRQLQLDAGRSQ